MQEFLVSVYPQLSSLGSSMPLKGTLPETSYHYAGMTLNLPSGISYEITLSNTGEAIIAMGQISAHIAGQCARCLGDAELDIKGELQGYYLRNNAGNFAACNAQDQQNATHKQGSGVRHEKNGKNNDEHLSSNAAKNNGEHHAQNHLTKNHYTQDDEQDFEEIAAEEVVGYVDDKGNIDLSDACLAALVYATPYVVVCKEDCKGLCPKCGANLNEDPTHNHDDEIDPSNPFAFLKDYKFRDE